MQDARPAKGVLVMKFGGTSVGSPEALAQAVDIMGAARADWERVVVVASAMAGVTDLLLHSAGRAAQSDVEPFQTAEGELRHRHFDAADALIPDLAARRQVKEEIASLITMFVELCRAIAVIGEASPRALDAVASLGERMCVRLLAGVAAARGIPAEHVDSSEIIITNDHFQNAYPDFAATTQKTRQRLEPLLGRGVVPIVTGFIGATPSGAITTLGRGGSDYSAAILGAVLPAEEVWICTDVDGVMTADPRLVPSARTLPEITYSEIAELAYYGAKVLHPKTIRPVVEAGIRLRICNTFNPTHPGTRLVPNQPGKSNSGTTIKAVTAIRNQKLITIEGHGMLGVPGVAARAFGAVASTRTSVPLITQASSEQSICFAVPSETTASVLAALEAAFSVELAEGDIDRIWSTEDVSIITVVGAGMKHTPGVAGLVFSQLGREHINVLAIAQGSSEVSISMVVDNADTEAAVKALHNLFVK